MRTKDLELLLRTMAPYLPEIKGFYPEQWLNDDRNIALTNDKEDLGLFQFDGDGLYTGHYFFNSRGKEAYKTGVAFLKEIFNDPYDVRVIRGITPHDKKGALWMNRKLGFKEYGDIDTCIGPCRLVLMTKPEWVELNKEIKE